MPTTKRVGILTGGGDVPGLNMCLKSLVYRSIDLGFEPIGVRKGWEGLIHYNPSDPTTYSDYFLELTKNLVRPIDRAPGSFLHSSRLDPRCVPAKLTPEFLRTGKEETYELTDHLIHVVERLGYQALIVIGDDDTLSYAAHLAEKGLPVLAIPKTIHNNIIGTDYTLGFSTGMARGVAFIHELRALAGSREQTVVIETFAAKSGYSTLLMAWLAGVDRCVIPESPYDPDLLAYVLQLDKRQNPTNYAVLLVSDGAHPNDEKTSRYAHILSADSERILSQEGSEGGVTPRRATRAMSSVLSGERLVGSGMIAAQLLAHITGEEVFLQPLTYLLRTGSPDGQDLLGASNFALIAARLLHEGRFGRMSAFVQNKMWTDVELNEANTGVKHVDVENWYDHEDYKPRMNLIWSSESSA